MSKICVVLVEPQGPLNIGSVCRSIMNFGVVDLRLVNPCENYNGFEARRMALKATEILNQARVFDSLPQAIEDCSLIFGTTRRFGKYRLKSTFLSPEEAAKQVIVEKKETQVAYVFGREDAGLKNSELEICNFHVTIETNKLYSSINLSHAVSLCMYELEKQLSKGLNNVDMSVLPLANSKKMEYMFKHMRKTLLRIGYLNPDNPDHIIRTFRRILSRAGLCDRDVRILHGLWSRIDWIERELGKYFSGKLDGTNE